MSKRKIEVPVLADVIDEDGRHPEWLFWVGSAGSYDDRAKKITRDFVRILEHTHTDYAVLGEEEIDTGDSAKRAGNEFLFQMQAADIIALLNEYGVKKIVTCDPHDYNTLKNEYPELGGKYDVWHHTQFIKNLIDEGKLEMDNGHFSKQRITYHDPCYLGRGNGEYEAPRFVLKQLRAGFVEMERHGSRSLCCGAGGAQMFKEAEPGTMEVNELRTQDAMAVQPDIIVTACPFCMTMMSDGVKFIDKADEVAVLDLAEVVSKALGLEAQ